MYSVVLKNFFTLKRFLAFVNSVSGGFVCLFVCLLRRLVLTLPKMSFLQHVIYMYCCNIKTTILFQTELIQKAKDAVELKKREDFEMLKEQMEEALKVR